MLTATVSGSFHRHMEAITRAVHELVTLSVRVLSPADPRVVAAQGDFLFVASDRVRSVRLVQDRHLESIRAADFLWLVCPDGYVGSSASMEVGFAAAARVPIYATRVPSDLTLREYVQVVSSLDEAVQRAKRTFRTVPSPGLLIDPHDSIERVHQILERVDRALACRRTDTTEAVYRDLDDIHNKLEIPSSLQ